MATTHTVNKSEQIKRALMRRYPCAEVPYGVQTLMADEFGVSRELVRQQVLKLRFTTAPTVPKEITVCGRCGKQMTHGAKDLCRACRFVEIPCTFCEKPKRVSARWLATQVNRKTTAPDGTELQYSGKVFCDRTCFGKWFGLNYGRGAQRRAKGLLPASEAPHGTMTRFHGGCRCDECRGTAKEYNRRYYDPNKAKRPPQVFPPKKCDSPKCEVVFTPIRVNNNTCSRRCWIYMRDRRNAAKRVAAHAALMETMERTCGSCEEVFVPTRINQKYCKPACYRVAQKKLWAARLTVR